MSRAIYYFLIMFFNPIHLTSMKCFLSNYEPYLLLPQCFLKNVCKRGIRKQLFPFPHSINLQQTFKISIQIIIWDIFINESIINEQSRGVGKSRKRFNASVYSDDTDKPLLHIVFANRIFVGQTKSHLVTKYWYMFLNDVKAVSH